MQGFLRALRGGPGWAGPGADAGLRLACWPLLVLCAVVVGAAVLGLAGPFGSMLLRSLTVAAPRAAMATLGCCLVAWPAALARPGAIWLVPLWFAPALAAAGAALWPLDAAWGGVVVTGCLCLPVMVLGFASAGAAVPAGLWRAAALAGAPGWARLRLMGRLIAPGVGRTVLLVWVLAAGVLRA
jgi:hypothetical protein